MMIFLCNENNRKTFLFFSQSLDRQGDLKSLSLGEINHGFSWEQVKLPYHNSLKLKCINAGGRKQSNIAGQICKEALICQEGKSMTPHWKISLSSIPLSNSQLSRLCLGPLKGFSADTAPYKSPRLA